MNFRDACLAMADGKKICRGNWPTGRYLGFNRHGELYSHLNGKNTLCRNGMGSNLADDGWQLYMNPNYQPVNNWDWALTQLRAGKKVTSDRVGSNTYYYLQYDLMYAYNTRTFDSDVPRACSLSLAFFDCETWCLYDPAETQE